MLNQYFPVISKEKFGLTVEMEINQSNIRKTIIFLRE